MAGVLDSSVAPATAAAVKPPPATSSRRSVKRVSVSDLSSVKLAGRSATTWRVSASRTSLRVRFRNFAASALATAWLMRAKCTPSTRLSSAAVTVTVWAAGSFQLAVVKVSTCDAAPLSSSWPLPLRSDASTCTVSEGARVSTTL